MILPSLTGLCNFLTGKLRENSLLFQVLTLVQTTANNIKEGVVKYIKTLGGLDVNNIVQQIKENVAFVR
jgi:hypothetical protein